jgi:Pathogenicity locus
LRLCRNWHFASQRTFFLDLQRLTGKRQDPCVYDVFAAAIHQAQTGEAQNWWAFTSARKELQKKRLFPFGDAG